MKAITRLFAVALFLFGATKLANARNRSVYYGLGTAVDSSSNQTTDTFGNRTLHSTPSLGSTSVKSDADVTRGEEYTQSDNSKSNSIRGENDSMVSQECADGELSGKDCQFHWLPALGEQGEFLAIETSWNLAQNKWVRYWTFAGNFWHNYFLALKHFRFSRWSDDSPFYDDYVGHPMMGAITIDIFIQNDPRGRSLEFENSKEYWHSRLWALLGSSLYSAEWKLGPISESSIGNQGIGFYYDTQSRKWTNGTGTVGLVVTPVGGWVWSVAEDLLDEHVIKQIETRSSNRLYLFSIQLLNPCRGFSNLLRFKAPWYRDSRRVRAGRPNRSRHLPAVDGTQVTSGIPDPG